MNKREKAEMINIIVPLDNLFFFVEHIEDHILKNSDVETEILIQNIREYKKKLLKNLNAIEETKDILMEIVHLKVANERLTSKFSKSANY